jgi:hypothetical protein
VATLPTRDFVIVMDPHLLEHLLITYPLDGVLPLVADLARLRPPIRIRFLFAAYVATPAQQHIAESQETLLDVISNEAEIPEINISRNISRRVRERIERGAEGDCRGLRLLALSEHVKADGVLTTIPSLVESRWLLLQHHQIRIVPPEELADFVEVSARGHGVACAAPPAAPMWPPPDALYQFTHWKGRRLFDWYSSAGTAFADGPLRELLRSALLNRYPFILHARDMVHFNQLQAHHYLRRGRGGVFRASINYHLTAFYTHVWGMLDTLAQIANRRLGLGVDPFRCHINRDDFLDALREKHPGLSRFIDEHGGDWIAVIGDVRHPIAHSALRLQGDVMAETEESKKTDEQIAAILREEEPDRKGLPADVYKTLEPLLISNWRISKLRLINDDVIRVEQPDGRGYLRHPVASIDFDIARINAFIDAFLVGCFSHPPPRQDSRG